MNASCQQPPNVHYEQTALLLQGGGALGAYQAGVYECLQSNFIVPDWVAGISIGAVNAAIIAGNRPEKRVEQLRAFWNGITESYPEMLVPFTDTLSRHTHAAVSTLFSVCRGIPGFFSPRLPPAWLRLPGASGATSFYDTHHLRETLLRHIDFDRINAGATRLTLAAVNIRTGNRAHFDSLDTTIEPEHIMASGALPPGFPPVEIDGEIYWDGGLVSNTPLPYVLNHSENRDTLVFQVDLFSARGSTPQTMDEVEERRKDIVYSSRTRFNTDAFREKLELKQAITQLAEYLPATAHQDPAVKKLLARGCNHKTAIVHLIYRRAAYGGAAKDYEFSRRSMTEHWRAGNADAQRTLRTTQWQRPPAAEAGISVHDMTQVDTL